MSLYADKEDVSPLYGWLFNIEGLNDLSILTNLMKQAWHSL